MSVAYYLQLRGPPLRRLRGGSGAGRHAPLRDPAVPPAEGLDGPRAEPRLGARRDASSRTCGSAATSTSATSSTTTTRSTSASAATSRTSSASPASIADGTVNALENLYNSTRGIPVPRLKGARVVVIGGGFTAIDCTRTSVRQGAAEVTLVYRRDLKDMPAADEAHEAIEEGARLIFQAAPVRIVTDENGKVTGVEFQRMKLGEPDEQGRRRPEPMAGTEFIVECDTVLGAIGQGPDLAWVESEPEEIRVELEVCRRGTLESEEHIFRTDVPKVFASGDVRTGAATVVEAIGEGRRASYAMDYWLRGHDLDDPQVRRIVTEPQPNFLTIVPFTDDVKEPKAIMGKLGADGAQDELRRVRVRLHARPGDGRGVPLPPVHLRGDRPLRPARGGDRVRDDAEHGDRRALDPGQPVRRRQPRLRPRRDALVHPARLLAAASTAADAPRSARTSSAPAATTSSARASTRSSPPPTSSR